MRKLIIICFAVIATITQAMAQGERCSSVMLDEISQLLNQQRLESSKEGVYSYSKVVKGKEFRVSTKNNKVSELGLMIFNREMFVDDNSLFMDFVERYMLYLTLLPEDKIMQYMNEDRVSLKCNPMINGGSIKTKLIGSLETISEKSSIVINSDTKNYNIMWVENRISLLSLTVPIDVFLITGMNKKEISERFAVELKSYIGKADKPKTEYISPSADMLDVGKNGIYTLKRNKHLIDILVSDNYYMKTSEGFTPIYNAKYPVESMANLFTVPIDRGLDVEITVNKYGYEKEVIKMKLYDFVSFLKHNECEMFVGVEEHKANSLIGTAMAVNIGLAYAHILYFNFDLDLFKSKTNKKLTVEINSFIPTHNLKSLFEVNIKNK